MASLADVSRPIMRSAQAARKLDENTERTLIARYQTEQNQAAIDAVAAAFLRRVLQIANRFRGYGLPLDDLVQEGCCGVMLAAQKFDTARDVPFGAYATLWAKAEMREFILRNASMVRLPMGSVEQKMFFKLRQLRTELSRDESMTPSAVTSEIAERFGVSVQDVEIMQARLSQGDVALNAPAYSDDDDGSEVGDFFAAELPEIGAMLDDQQCAADLRQAMADLDDRERMIVEERWLTDDIAPLNALADWFEVSVPVVRRLEIGAIDKLRKSMFAMRAAPRPEYA